MKLIKDLEKVRRDCKTNSEKFAVERAIRVISDWFEGEPYETEQPSQIESLKKQVESLRQANKDLASAALSPNINEAQELERAIETVQAALSGSFRGNLRLEVSEQHAWLTYGDLKFLVEPMEAWQAVQSCVYLSGLEVDCEPN